MSSSSFGRVFGLCLTLLIGAAAAACAANHDRLDQVLQQLEQVHSFSSVAISPDGHWVAWVAKRPDSKTDSLFVLDWKQPSARPREISAGEPLDKGGSSGVVWAPDSSRVAFLNHGESGQDQIYVAEAENFKARRVSDLNGYVKSLRWSPDGAALAFLYAEHGGGGGPLEAVPAQTGVIGGELHNQRLALLSAHGGDLRQITKPELNIYEYEWAPAGDAFAAIAAPGPADNNWWIAKLYTVNSASGDMTMLFAPPVERQIAAPHWSPDGSRIGFLAGLMSDEGFDGGDIFILNKNGGEPRNVTGNLKATPTGFNWRDRNTLLYTEAKDGSGGVVSLDLGSGSSEVLWQGPQSLHQDGNFPDLSIAKDDRTSAAIRSDWQHPPEIVAGPIGDWKNVTHSNADQTPHWGKAESLTWQNDGARVQGWLLYPDHFDASQRYPLIVSIHGGPSGVHAASWPSVHFDMSVMASLGYFVFFPNPRGSYGEGEAFTRANVKDFGGGDLRDILAGVDTAVKHAPIDENRIGVTGWSYGGYMTMWTVTQTNRFRAAVAGAGIANWLSYYGENSIDEWMIPFFGASVYDDPQVYAKSSPITYIKQVKTPTLVVVGERDGECPAPQSFEFWHALKAQNVPTELVVYPGEGHSFHDPGNRADVLRRTVLWFERYLG